MTREDIIRMAREAGLHEGGASSRHPNYNAQGKAIERFAALVAAAKREPATVEQVIAAHGPSWGPSATPDFFTGFRAAERHHGIRKEDK